MTQNLARGNPDTGYDHDDPKHPDWTPPMTRTTPKPQPTAPRPAQIARISIDELGDMLAAGTHRTIIIAGRNSSTVMAHFLEATAAAKHHQHSYEIDAAHHRLLIGDTTVILASTEHHVRGRTAELVVLLPGITDTVRAAAIPCAATSRTSLIVELRSNR